MEFSVEHALQRAVTAHKEGKLQDAERLYRAILQYQPTHPDANHNLGLIAVSANQVEEALSLFKIALDVNPKFEQFWMSYVDALVQNQQLYDAKRAIKKAKKTWDRYEETSSIILSIKRSGRYQITISGTT